MVSLPAGRTLLLVGLVVIAAGVATGVTSSASSPGTEAQATEDVQTSLVQVDGTVNYMQVSDADLEKSGLHRESVDVTASTRITGDRLELQVALESFHAQFENADTEAERTAAIREAVRTLDEHTEAVKQRQTRALERYNNGQITTDEFVSTLVRVDATAESIDEVATRVGETNTVDYSIPSTLETKLGNYETRLLPVRGDVRKFEFRPAVAGIERSGPTYIETGEDGITIATIADGQYVRSSVENGAFGSDSTAQFRVTDAIDRVTTLYPWAMNTDNRNQTAQFKTLLDARAFQAYIQHNQGELTVYLDAASEDVFKEQQTRDVTAAPITRTFTNGTDQATLTVDATHDTGPLSVSLVQGQTNESINASVYVDGTFVGTTGSDGHLWTLDTRDTTSLRVRTNAGETLTVQIPDGALPG